MKKLIFAIALATISQAHAFNTIDPVPSSYTFSGPMNFTMYGVSITCQLHVEAEFEIMAEGNLGYILTSITSTGPNWGCSGLAFQGDPWDGVTTNNETPISTSDPFPIEVDGVSVIGPLGSCGASGAISALFYNGTPASSPSSIEIDADIGNCTLTTTISHDDVNIY